MSSPRRRSPRSHGPLPRRCAAVIARLPTCNPRRACAPVPVRGIAQNGGMSFWRRLGAALGKPPRWGALACGALLVLAFPAPNIEFLAWFGLVPALLLMRAASSAREAAVRSWWFGAGFIIAAHYWLAPNIGPALLLVAIVLGACWIGVGISIWALLRSPVTPWRALAALVVVPSYWLLVEWIRSWQAVGAARREPVAASGDPRAGRGRRRMAGQLRHSDGQHRHRHPYRRARRHGSRPGWRRHGRCRSRRAGRVRAHL